MREEDEDSGDEGKREAETSRARNIQPSLEYNESLDEKRPRGVWGYSLIFFF